MQAKPMFLNIRATPALISALDRAVAQQQETSLRGTPSRSTIVREAIIQYLNRACATVAPADKRED
jgi:metal-responsive CopG/Arc/MetJ family transcriptional regulator